MFGASLRSLSLTQARPAPQAEQRKDVSQVSYGACEAPAGHPRRSWSLTNVRLLAACLLLAPSALAQEPFLRLSDGRPDIEGRWTMRTLTPFARPSGVSQLTIPAAEEAAMIALIMQQRLAAERFDPGTSDPDGDSLARVDGELRTSAIVSPADGQVALTPAGQARLALRPDGYDGPEARPVNERCIADAGRAPYRVMSGEMFFQIIQTPAHLVIHKEGMDPPRIFHLADRGQTGAVTPWWGQSSSRWEKDVFVIDTTGFRPDDVNRRISGPGAAGFPIEPDTRITEWIIPVSRDELLYRYRVEDADLFSEPLIAELPMLRTEKALYESACHEGNISLANTLRGARVTEEAQGSHKGG
jgi:hypothetical protein